MFFPPNGRIDARRLDTRQLHADVLEDARDIIVYETGMAQVAKLASLTFVPGALADHLTSLGGDLLGQEQMSSLRWLEAGATAQLRHRQRAMQPLAKVPEPGSVVETLRPGRQRDRSVLEERGLAHPGAVHRRTPGCTLCKALIEKYACIDPSGLMHGHEVVKLRI